MPDTIAENLQRLVDAKDDIAEAITAKGGTVASGDGLEEFAADIATIPSGGSSAVPKKDVNFYDYDGTVVASYTAAEFAELTEMPANPTHDGLTAQGWNWSLADAKTYVATYSKLNIGQMYITSDGKTRLYIELTEGRLQPYLKLYLNANSELDIDWGDGSVHSTFTNAGSSSDYVTEMHTYASAGKYIIAITVISGGFNFQSSSETISTLLTNNNASTTSPDVGYLGSIKKVEIGSGVTRLGEHAFHYCRHLTSVTIPNEGNAIEKNAFANCTTLSSITIPSSVTSIDSNAFTNCVTLSSITIPSSVTSIANAFQYCYNLSSITIPNSVTSIDSNAFANCTTLSSITIPNSVTSIDSNTFKNCYALATITINKASGSISGSPWGAITSSPTSTQIVWTG